MTTKMLDKFDAILHFLPKLQMTIDAGRYNEVCFSDNNMCDYISMHVTLLIAFSVW